MRRMYSQSQINQIVKNAIANGLLDDVDVNAKSLSADSIIENMSGYSFSVTEEAGWTKDIAYAGVVKNGNKLTMVISGNYTRTSDSASSYPELGTFTIPSEIGAKIYPISLDFIDFRILEVFVSLGDSTPVRAFAEKVDGTHIKLSSYSATTLNKTYNYRYELTFLLSENLAPQE